MVSPLLIVGPAIGGSDVKGLEFCTVPDHSERNPNKSAGIRRASRSRGTEKIRLNRSVLEVRSRQNGERLRARSISLSWLIITSVKVHGTASAIIPYVRLNIYGLQSVERIQFKGSGWGFCLFAKCEAGRENKETAGDWRARGR